MDHYPFLGREVTVLSVFSTQHKPEKILLGRMSLRLQISDLVTFTSWTASRRPYRWPGPLRGSDHPWIMIRIMDIIEEREEGIIGTCPERVRGKRDTDTGGGSGESHTHFTDENYMCPMPCAMLKSYQIFRSNCHIYCPTFAFFFILLDHAESVPVTSTQPFLQVLPPLQRFYHISHLLTWDLTSTKLENLSGC